VQRVIITGASSGIGAALARLYAQRHTTLGLIARRQTELERLTAQLSVPLRIYVADVRDASAMQSAAADFISRYGAPDLVIANAGVSLGTLTEFAGDLVAFQDVIDVNVVGAVKTFQPFLGSMRTRGTGVLVGIASVAGYRGLPGAAAYSASKAAMISYLESLRVELRGSGIKVITICPGYVATPMTVNNPYAMPFILSADAVAQKIVSIVDRGKTFAVIPWQMAFISRVMGVLPNCIYDPLFANAPRKPRRIP